MGEAADGEEAVRLAVELEPEVLLMDLRMPVLAGLAATCRITQAPAAPRVLVLTTFDDDESVFDAVRAGALGYLLEDTRSAMLVDAIRARLGSTQTSRQRLPSTSTTTPAMIPRSAVPK